MCAFIQYVCAQTQLHAMRGYCGSALMCSAVIIRTELCPIRRRDRQWKHSIDDLHFMIKPITTWKGEKKEWNNDENELQREKDKDSFFSSFSLNIFFSAFLGLVTECDQSLQTNIGTKCYFCCCFDLVYVCVHVEAVQLPSNTFYFFETYDV